MLGITFKGRNNRTQFWMGFLFCYILVPLSLGPFTYASIKAIDTKYKAQIAAEKAAELAKVLKKTKETSVSEQKVRQVSPDEFNALLKGEEYHPAISQAAEPAPEAEKPKEKQPELGTLETIKNINPMDYLVYLEVDKVSEYINSLSSEETYIIIGIIALIHLYALILMYSIQVKRGHDLGYSGWVTFFLSLIPTVLYFYYGCMSGDVEFNDYD